MAQDPDYPASEPEHASLSVPLEGADAFTETALEIHAESRRHALGAFLRRLVQRFSSDQLLRQEVYNRVLLKAVRENREHGTQVSRHLGRVSETVELLQKTFETQSRAHGSYLGQVSETVEYLQRDLEAQGQLLGRQIGQLSGSLEQLQKNLEEQGREHGDVLGRLSGTLEQIDGAVAGLGRDHGDTLGQLSATLEQIDGAVAGLGRDHGDTLGQLSATLEQIDGAVGALGQKHGEYLGQLSEKLDALGSGIDQQGEEHGAHLGAVSAGLELAQADLAAQGQEHGEYLGQLSEKLDALGSGIDQQGEEHGAHLGAVSAGLAAAQADLAAQGQEHGEHLGLVSHTIEQLQTAHGRVRETTRAQGRHLDEVAANLADLREQEQELSLELEARQEDRELERDAQQREIIERVDDLREAHAVFTHRMSPNQRFDHFDFARRYRGEEADLQERMESYAVLFGPVVRLLDVGCGRGEFLEACRAKGVGAYGIESDSGMVSRCRMKGLEVVQGDALVHLEGLEDQSLDGIFMAQVIEHLTNSEIGDFIALAAQKLRRGAQIIIETINPDTFAALRWFFLDPTHRQPVSSEALKFLLEDAGFTLRDVLRLSPVPSEQTLQPLPSPRSKAGQAAEIPRTSSELVRSYNENLKKLNEVLFGDQDYAVIAER